MRLKKYIAEFLGTAILVLFGCGTAVWDYGISFSTYCAATIEPWNAAARICWHCLEMP